MLIWGLHVGKFANMESINNKDPLRVCVCVNVPVLGCWTGADIFSLVHC